MKTIIITAILGLIIITSSNLKAQDLYTASSGEMIFSFSDVTDNGNKVDAGMRFTVFFHAQHALHVDFNNHFGFSVGLGIRNIGITPAPDSVYFHGDKTYYYRASAGASVNQLTTVKQRTYTLGVPIAFKIGDFNKDWYIFAGGEYEYAFHYKEKIWLDGKKKKYTKWFGDATTLFLPSVFAGVKLPGGATIKFKWYLQNFLNNDHTADIVDGNTVTKIEPYKHINTQLFYVSIAYTIDNRKPKSKPSSGMEAQPKIDM